MRKVLIAAVGVFLMVSAFANEAFAQRAWRGGGFYGGGLRGLGVAGGYRNVAWRGGGVWRGGGWGYRPYRPLLWGAAALGTVAALSYAAPYGYGYGYAPAYVDPYASYASYGYGNGYGYRPVYASSYGYECVTTPQLVWNGWAYRRVWVQTC